MRHFATATACLVLIASLCAPAQAKDYIYVPAVNSLEIIDCDSDTVVKSVPYNDYIVGSIPSPDGKRYYLNAFHSIYVIDTQTDELIDTFKLSSELNKVDVLGFGISNDGKQLYLSCSITKKKQNIPRLNVLPPQLVVYDVNAKRMVKNYQIPMAMSGIVALRNDPDHVFVLGLDIHKLNLKTGGLEKVAGMVHPEEGEEGKNALVIWQNGSPGDHGLFTNPYYTGHRHGLLHSGQEHRKAHDAEGQGRLVRLLHHRDPGQEVHVRGHGRTGQGGYGDRRDGQGHSGEARHLLFAEHDRRRQKDLCRSCRAGRVGLRHGHHGAFERDQHCERRRGRPSHFEITRKRARTDGRGMLLLASSLFKNALLKRPLHMATGRGASGIRFPRRARERGCEV